MTGNESLAEALKEAAVKGQFGGRRTQSKADRIKGLKSEIAALRAKHATWEEIAAILCENGLRVSTDTVRKAITTKPRSYNRRNGNLAAPVAQPSAPARKRGAQPVSPTTDGEKKFGAAGRQY